VNGAAHAWRQTSDFGDTMQYMKLNTAQREELLVSLNRMPEYLRCIILGEQSMITTRREFNK
jgi:hypothetical protein